MPAGQVAHRNSDQLTGMLSVAVGLMDADLSIDGLDADLQQTMVDVVGGMRFPAQDLQLSFSLGMLAEGDVHYRGRRFRLDPGFRAGVQLSWRALNPDGGVPFIDLGTAIAAGISHTREAGQRERWTTIDFRASVAVGWRILDAFNPYLAVRGFGGPVLWTVDGTAVTGTDRTHIQTVVGASLNAAGITMFVDWSFFGERALWIGIGYALPSGEDERAPPKPPEPMPVAAWEPG